MKKIILLGASALLLFSNSANASSFYFGFSQPAPVAVYAPPQPIYAVAAPAPVFYSYPTYSYNNWNYWQEVRRHQYWEHQRQEREHRREHRRDHDWRRD